MFELPLSVELGADLVVEVEELLEGLGPGGHDEANDVHEQLRHGIAVEHNGQDALHGVDLGLVGAFLELGPQLGQGRCALGGTVLDQTVCIVEEGHGEQRAAGSRLWW